MNKTVLTELIEKLKIHSPKESDRSDSIASQGYHEGIQWAIYFAQSLIPKEKEVIMKAFQDGYNNGNVDSGKIPEQYFTQTYKQ